MDMSALKDLLDRYPQNIFPSIWNKIEALLDKDELLSHVEVLREIKETTDKTDKLLKWSAQYKKIFEITDECQRTKLDEIKAAYEKDYWEREYNKPGPWADPWIIAMAKCGNAVIITQENKKKPNNIPAIARNFGIDSLNLLEFFDMLKIQL